MMPPRAVAWGLNAWRTVAGESVEADVTLSWSEDLPMEIRVTMWEAAKDGGQEAGVVWHLSRALLAEGTNPGAQECIGVRGTAGVWYGPTDGPVAFFSGPDHLVMNDLRERLGLTFKTEQVAAFVRTTLAMCPAESEALDVDGLITEIFHHAEEADQ